MLVELEKARMARADFVTGRGYLDTSSKRKDVRLTNHSKEFKFESSSKCDR